MLEGNCSAGFVLGLAAASLAAVGLAWAYPAAAQGNWPTQPVKFIVPNPPGGLPDVLSRIVADRLKDRLGQSVIVENRPGANAGIGAAAVTASKPDGYTFLVSDSAVVNISHLLNAQLPFNPKDLVPMVLIARAPIFLGANTELPVKTFKEMIEHAKANPGKINYGSIGVGTYSRWARAGAGGDFAAARGMAAGCAHRGGARLSGFRRQCLVYADGPARPADADRGALGRGGEQGFR